VITLLVSLQVLAIGRKLFNWQATALGRAAPFANGRATGALVGPRPTNEAR
jgi:hypothetical protein